MTSFQSRLDRINSTQDQTPHRRTSAALARLPRVAYGAIWMAIPSFAFWNMGPIKDGLNAVPALAANADTYSSVIFLVSILWILFTFGAILRPLKKALWFLENPTLSGYIGSRVSFYDAFGTPSIWFSLGTVLGLISPILYILVRYA